MPLELHELAEQLRAIGVLRTPPVVLLTRWQTLLGDDRVIYFDATFDSGKDVSGSRYSFFGATDVAVCYLVAEHDNEMWEYDRDVGRTSDEITPRTLVAWRRPIKAVVEMGVGGSPWDWLADEAVARPLNPVYRLVIGSDEIELPLPSRYRQQPKPDPGPLFERIRDIWQV